MEYPPPAPLRPQNDRTHGDTRQSSTACYNAITTSETDSCDTGATLTGVSALPALGRNTHPGPGSVVSGDRGGSYQAHGRFLRAGHLGELLDVQAWGPEAECDAKQEVSRAVGAGFRRVAKA